VSEVAAIEVVKAKGGYSHWWLDFLYWLARVIKYKPTFSFGMQSFTIQTLKHWLV